VKGRLEKRSKSSWTIVIDMGRDPATGKTKRIYKAVQGNKTQAKQVMEQMLAELQQGTYVAPTKTTLADYLGEWLKLSCQPRLAPKTLYLYRQYCNNHIKPHLGQMRLTDIEPRHIQSLYSELLKDGVGKRMVEVVHIVLNSSLKQAVKWQLIRQNPVAYATPPKAERKKVNALKPHEIPLLMTAAKGSPIENLIFIALATGMRKGELLALKWSDIDLDSGVINVQRALVRINGETVIKSPKSKYATRPVSVDPIALETLRAMKVNSRSEFVFVRKNGLPMDPSTVTHKFKTIAKAAGFSELRFHDLRHTHASLLLARKVHPKVVQERLGHSSIAITMDIYSHLIPSLQQEAADVVGKFASGWRQNGDNAATDYKEVQ